jgi:hypothetical protein
MYYNGFKDSQMSKQGTACKKKHGTLMIPQKLLIIIMRHEVEVMASYTVISLCTI